MSGNEASERPSTSSANSSLNTFTPTFKKKKKKFTISTKNMGVNIDKNEYYEIKCSNSAHPERGL